MIIPSTALAIQGGAMRSMYCAGAVEGLLVTHQLDTLTHVVSSSGGCVAGLGILAAQYDAAAYHALTETMTSRLGKRFINLRRIRTVVDIAYLVDTMFDVYDIKPGFFDELESYEVVMTTADGSALYIDCRELSMDELRQALIGTMAIPVLYPVQTYWRGQQVFDGGIVDQLPVLRAIEISNADRVIGISSVKRGQLANSLPRGSQLAVAAATYRLPPAVRHQLLTRNPLGDTTEELLDQGHYNQVTLHCIMPTNNATLVHLTELCPARLTALQQMGYNDAISLFRE